MPLAPWRRQHPYPRSNRNCRITGLRLNSQNHYALPFNSIGVVDDQRGNATPIRWRRCSNGPLRTVLIVCGFGSIEQHGGYGAWDAICASREQTLRYSNCCCAARQIASSTQWSRGCPFGAIGPCIGGR